MDNDRKLTWPSRSLAIAFLQRGGRDHNVAEKFIANPSEKNDQGYWIEVSAHSDGSFTVHNNRNQFEKSYQK
jgi:hypothetical protein